MKRTTTKTRAKNGAKRYELSAKTKRELDQDQADKYELEYLMICRRVAAFLGGSLHGSSNNDGCTIFSRDEGGRLHRLDAPHWVVKRLASFLGVDVEQGVHREAELPRDWKRMTSG